MRYRKTYRAGAIAVGPAGRLMDRVGRENFAGTPATGDASWVGYRLAEMLPLPLPIKQTMLEINDCEVRLKVIAQFLKEQEVL